MISKKWSFLSIPKFDRYIQEMILNHISIFKEDLNTQIFYEFFNFVNYSLCVFSKIRPKYFGNLRFKLDIQSDSVTFPELVTVNRLTIFRLVIKWLHQEDEMIHENNCILLIVINVIIRSSLQSYCQQARQTRYTK